MSPQASRGKQASIVGVGNAVTLAEGESVGMARSWALYLSTDVAPPVGPSPFLAQCQAVIQWGVGGVMFTRLWNPRVVGDVERVHAETVRLLLNAPAAFTAIAGLAVPSPNNPLVALGAAAECPSFDGDRWCPQLTGAILAAGTALVDIPAFASKVCAQFPAALTLRIEQLSSPGPDGIWGTGDDVVVGTLDMDSTMEGRPMPLHAQARKLRVTNTSAATLTPVLDFWVQA